MNKKLLAMGLSVTMIAGMLTGCGSSSTESGDSTASTSQTQSEVTEQNTASEISQTAASDDEPITLRFAWWGGDERNAATLEVIEQFEALHPNVTIEAEYGGNDGYHDKLATQLASGTAADIVQVDPETFPQYVSTGDYFVNYMDYSNMDLSTFDENYISLEINGRYDGKQLGLPTGISGAGILVNQDLADEIGIDFTQAYTWDDLLEMGRKVREYDDSMYLLCANKEYIVNLIVFNYGKQLCGSTLFDKETGELNITEEQMAELMQYVKKLYDEGVVAPASYSMSQLPMLSGCTEKGWASNTPQVMAVTKTCEHPEMAVEFMNYFFNNETALATLGATRSVPPTENARKICSENGKLSEVTMEGANIAAAAGGTPNDKISSSEEAKTILFDAVETVGYGATTPEEAASEIIDSLSSL